MPPSPKRQQESFIARPRGLSGRSARTSLLALAALSCLVSSLPLRAQDTSEIEPDPAPTRAPTSVAPAPPDDDASSPSKLAESPTADESVQPVAGSGTEPEAPATDGQNSLFTNDLPRELWSSNKQDAFHGSDTSAQGVSMIQLVDSEIVSASNQAESSLTAPAWVISLTQQELLDRGYVELTELLDDLPSMDIIRPFGSTYIRNYWRGARSNSGSPFLLMIDGVVLNSLWANETTVFGALPLSSIEHVEIVYGPASAIYGPNAAMGVINVITNRGAAEKGLHSDARITLAAAGSAAFRNLTKIADTSLRYNGDGWRLLGSLRFEFGVLDPSIADKFEWTKDKYYRSEHWGRFGSLQGVGEGFRSPDEKTGGSLRLIVGRHAACGDRDVARGQGQCTEIAVQHYTQTTGLGTMFPAPISQTRPTWGYLEQGAYIRHVRDMSSSLTSETRVSLRSSSIDPESQTLFYDTVVSDDMQVHSLIGGGRVGAEGKSWMVTQDFNLDLGKNLLLRDDVLGFKLGLRYARVTLDHDLIYSDTFVEVNGTPLPAEQLAMVDGLAPEAVDSRSNIDLGGMYLFGFYSIAQTHYLNAGFRLDYSQSLRTVQPTLRVGYVGRLTSDLTVKLLFGQAVQEPTMGEILSSEGGTPMEEGTKLCSAECKNSGLRSEASQTLELSANYTTKYAALRVGGYYIRYIDAMVPDMMNIVRNAEKRNILGGDASLQVLLPLWPSGHLNVWAYYSLLALAKQTDVDSADKALAPIGDLSTHKILGGLTFRVSESLALTLLGRFIGKRDTVQTNPLEVNAYFTLDANIVVDNLFVRGLSLSIRATNLLNATYYHPGLLDASSGQDPATFTSDHRWLAGPHNSLLPQPGRELFATLRWAL